MKKHILKSTFSILMAMTLIISALLMNAQPVEAKTLSNVSYSYYNYNDVKVTVKGNKITIKASYVDYTKNDKSTEYKNKKITFTKKGKIKRYYCLTGDDYTGSVNLSQLKSDFKKLSSYDYGTIRLYVKGKTIVGYEIYG